MCQLLGMNCNVPTDICFSFTGFHHRGGHTDEHTDGWGIAFYEGAGCRVFLDTEPASSSPIAALVRKYPIHSKHVIAHIRKATVGGIALQNTHPFQRELWGRYWTFAHNGTLNNIESPPPGMSGRFSPVGTTDSEVVFCRILDALSQLFPHGEPDGEALLEAIASQASHYRALGSFNFLLSNGEVLYAHCATSLAYIERRAPFVTAHLIDEDYAVDFSTVTTKRDRVTVIATTPLTDNETWTSMQPGTLIEFRDGAAFRRRTPG